MCVACFINLLNYCTNLLITIMEILKYLLFRNFYFTSCLISCSELILHFSLKNKFRRYFLLNLFQYFKIVFIDNIHRNTLSSQVLHVLKILALAGMAQWIECWPVSQRVDGSIPSQDTCLGCEPDPQRGACERQPHIDVSLPLFLLPFPSL